MRAIRRLASTLALYGIPLLVVVAAMSWFGLRAARGVDPPFVTTTSTAMKPAVRPGHLVLLADARPGSIAVGDVVVFRDEVGDVTIRRVAARDQRGSFFEYVVAADNRPATARVTIVDDDVIGEVDGQIPLLGYGLVVARTGAGQLLIAAVCFFGFAGAFRARWARRRPPPAEPGSTPVSLPAAAAQPDEPQAVPYGGADPPGAPAPDDSETAMSITPAELRHVRFAQVRRGYDTEAVDRALESVADSIEELLHERHELVERVRQLESEVDRYREVETTLSQTLTLAERAADELKAEAQAEADRLMADARAQMAAAQQMVATAKETPMPEAPAAAAGSAMPDPAFIELLGETRAIRSLLQAVLSQGGGNGGTSPFTPR